MKQPLHQVSLVNRLSCYNSVFICGVCVSSLCYDVPSEVHGLELNKDSYKDILRRQILDGNHPMKNMSASMVAVHE